MQETVQSIQSEVKKDLVDTNELGDEYVEDFNIDDILDEITGNPEFWSLRYSRLYEDIFNSVNIMFKSPLPNNEFSSDDFYKTLESGIKNVVDTVGDNSQNSIDILNIRDRFNNFKQNNDDELTLKITIHADHTSIEIIDGYYGDGGIVTVDLNDNPTNSEEATLREYNNDLIDRMCKRTPFEYRPNKRFQRELYISINKTPNEDIVTVHLDSKRMKYTIFEKLFMKFGFSSPYRNEPINELDCYL